MSRFTPEGNEVADFVEIDLEDAAGGPTGESTIHKFIVS